MSEPLNQLLAEGAAEIVHGSFTGVGHRWWWERRMGGGIEICQELDPEQMAHEIANKLDRDPDEVRSVILSELGLEDTEPVVLTFEIPGDATSAEAAWMLGERSEQPEGLAAGIYRQVEEKIKRS